MKWWETFFQKKSLTIYHGKFNINSFAVLINCSTCRQKWSILISVAHRFSPLTQGWLFSNANEEGHHSTVSENHSYSFVYIFLFLLRSVLFVMQIHFVSPPKKQSWQMDDKMERILCFYREFYEGNPSVTCTKKLNDSSCSFFQILHFFFFFCMLAEGWVWDGGKQRQYHMVLLSQARQALNIYSPAMQQQQQQVYGSVWERNKETKGVREGCNAQKGNNRERHPDTRQKQRQGDTQKQVWKCISVRMGWCLMFNSMKIKIYPTWIK